MSDLKENKKFEAYSTSLCPECSTKIPMRIYEEQNTIYLEKTCPKHGKFEDIYWGDAELFKRFNDKWFNTKYDGEGIENTHTDQKAGCPFDCGLCPQHKTHTILGIIDITNRCNMACPICFALPSKTNYVYEPSYKQIIDMIKNLRANKPYACNSLQFSGGEPTIRNDLPELIKEAKNAGITHVEVNSNGLRFAEDIDFFKKVYNSGMDTLYLQFDGLNEIGSVHLRAKKKLVPIKKMVIENARKIGLKSIVLVVTLARNVNETELGKIIQYAVDNHDVIRCVNIQPISMAGRAKKKEMKKLRITIPDAINLIEKDTEGKIGNKDWRPVNWPVPIEKGMGILKNKVYPEFTMHPMCGAATFIIVDKDGSYKPITKVVDVDKFADIFWDIYSSGKTGKKLVARMKLLKLLPMVKSKLIRKLLRNVLTKGSYEALGEFMHQIVMVGIMHFQDMWNIDLERVQRCAIHYATPDGKIRPFCTYNSIHRNKIEKEFAISIEEYTRKTGKKIADCI